MDSTLLFAHQGLVEITQYQNTSIAPLQVFFFKIVVFANAFRGFEIGQRKHGWQLCIAELNAFQPSFSVYSLSLLCN
jgi:hypothetical protein